MKIENTFHQASIPLCTAHLEKAAYHVCAHLHLTKYSTEKNPKHSILTKSE